MHLSKKGPVRTDATRQQSNLKVAVFAGALPIAMLGLAYAAVPLYAMFCAATGYGGTTQRAAKSSDVVIDRTVTVLFDANVAGNLAWTFEPVQRTLDVKLGENAIAFYRATNTSDKPVTGRAVYNVAPEAAGLHFNKIACFCFTEQTLQPGESVEMPVTFFVDPGLATDKDAKNIQRIVLSYTFSPLSPTKPAATAVTTPNGAPKGT
jgi:cytochrome c oxidase assembly protein subunit 11